MVNLLLSICPCILIQTHFGYMISILTTMGIKRTSQSNNIFKAIISALSNKYLIKFWKYQQRADNIGRQELKKVKKLIGHFLIVKLDILNIGIPDLALKRKKQLNNQFILNTGKFQVEVQYSMMKHVVIMKTSSKIFSSACIS